MAEVQGRLTPQTGYRGLRQTLYGLTKRLLLIFTNHC